MDAESIMKVYSYLKDNTTNDVVNDVSNDATNNTTNMSGFSESDHKYTVDQFKRYTDNKTTMSVSDLKYIVEQFHKYGAEVIYDNTTDDVINDVVNDTTNDVVNDTTNDVVNDTTNDVVNDTTNDVVNDTTNDVVNDTTVDVVNYTTNDVKFLNCKEMYDLNECWSNKQDTPVFMTEERVKEICSEMINEYNLDDTTEDTNTDDECFDLNNGDYIYTSVSKYIDDMTTIDKYYVTVTIINLIVALSSLYIRNC
jgi:hypothetical protein